MPAASGQRQHSAPAAAAGMEWAAAMRWAGEMRDCLKCHRRSAEKGRGKPRRPSASLEIAGSALMGFPILG